MDFDYREWASLAKSNPEAFALRRARYISQFLADFGEHQQRLEGLKFIINTTRKPTHAPEFLAIAKTTSKSLSDLGDALGVLELLILDEENGNAPTAKNVVPIARELSPCKVIYLSPICSDLIEVLVPV
ncbi:MAG TPA: DUF3135 domain-containing protein [Rhodocyclaceae bacterium]|nr:DUF3135 domain-containing protein [Rhodocyclaceae bacterium]HUY02616.1 DUF3135 domain-containing protein [Rhodocyclaceae bacterium]